MLRPTISICFVDGILFPAVPEYHLSFRLLDTEHGVALSDDLFIHFIELPKFERSPEQLLGPLETWVYFLRHAQEMQPGELPGALNVPEIRQAMEALTMLTQFDMQKEIYEGRIKARRDERSRLYDAREDGLKQGLQQGMAKGSLIGRIEFAQKLLRGDITPRVELEAMSMEVLDGLAAQLEQELIR